MIQKLHDKFKPLNYKLVIDINSKDLTFSGEVEIRGLNTAEGKNLDLHAKDLTITSATVDSVPAGISHHDFDVLRITAENNLPEEILVDIHFEGKITDDMTGMYPCYFEHDGQKKWLVATQFESHYAREVFPCIDEPAAKATFDLTLVTDSSGEVLSNMPAISQEEYNPPVSDSDQPGTKDTRLRTIFETTPKMSTYLLAFVTGEMHFKESKTKDGVVVRSWSSVAQPISHLDYSVNEAVKIIEFYDDYFDTPYPLAKCDQVALPDFDAGAMENWGLITYRETALLSDPDNFSVISNQYVSIVIAHELSHQWFGNLVTMQWWDDLWLNESFASLIEYVAVDNLHPEWQIWENYTSSDVIIASNRDVYSDVQPVRVDVDNPAEISSLFDGAIVYAKGGRLLKMLREHIGDEAFRAGLKEYFKLHAYKNTTRDDLWDVMTKTTGQDIGSLMDSWLEQSGLPLLTVAQEDKKVSINQQRLLLDDKKPSDQIWQIPLLADQALSPEILVSKQQTFTGPEETPVILNRYGSGHFVVKYETKWQKDYLKQQLHGGDIPTEGKISMLNDSIILAKAGQDSLTESLRLISTLGSEPRDSVWSLVASVIGSSRMLIEGDAKAEADLKLFTKNLAKDWYDKLGWDFSKNDDDNTTQLRRTILGLMLSSEDDTVIKEAISRYQSSDPESIHAEVRSLLMSAVVRFSDLKESQNLIKLLKQTQNAELQLDISSALCSTKDINLAKDLTDLLKDKDYVRPQDLIRWYAYLLRNKHTRDLMWQWSVSNWGWLLDVFKSSKSYDYLPRYAANFMNSKKWLRLYTEFFTPMIEDPALTRTIKIGIKEIQARVDWRERDEKQIINWLHENI